MLSERRSQQLTGPNASRFKLHSIYYAKQEIHADIATQDHGHKELVIRETGQHCHHLQRRMEAVIA
jgi:hypothetical protein